jgi:ParB family chromosome partitioning protein
MTLHTLKVKPEFVPAIVSRAKPFELRKDDRGYKVGDILELVEHDEEKGSIGWPMRRTVTYILRDFPGLEPGYVVMGIA